MSLTELSLRWARQRAAVTTTLLGTSSMAQLDEDLVAWISVGREHITRQEDLPLVSNFGVAFSLQPWNFFPWNVAASGLQARE